jgi:uncharacterized sulfatase
MKHPLLLRLAVCVLAALGIAASAADRPNILWITSEDHSPLMGCYGDKNAVTPNVDALAARGMLFKRAWSCGPVCATARTTIIAGMYSSSTGGEYMRSMVPLPAGKKMYPQFLREAGYYCSNNSKEDYNLTKPEGTWDDSSNKAHYKNRASGQPFFAIFNATVSHESQLRKRPHTPVLDPAKVRVPAYHPDTPEVRQDWAQHYDTISEADAIAGKHLKELADAGLADDTIVFYYADHGSGMPRGKRWPGNSGLHVPMVVYFPPKWAHLAPKEYAAGGKSDRLVSFVDLAPTLLSIAGIQPPDWMQGHAFAGKFQTKPQPFIFGYRTRMDERYDVVRSATDGRYVYLRNFNPHVSQGQHVSYQFETPTTRVWRQLFDEGKATPAQSMFWNVPRSPEELYDLETDPDEVRNLAGSPQHKAVLEKLRKAVAENSRKHLDLGFLPEGELHTRSNGGSPYDMAREKGKYPFDRIYETADLASSLKAGATPKLVKALNDKDSAVRYWGALGLLMRGGDAVKAAHAPLQNALRDDSAYVRIVAAQALAQHGDASDLKPALDALQPLVQPKTSGQLIAMYALYATDAIGDKARPLVPVIKSMPHDGSSPDGRYNSYVPRLVNDILARFNEKPAPAAAEGKAKKGKKKQ